MALIQGARCRHGLPYPNWRNHPVDMSPHLMGRRPQDVWRSRRRLCPNSCNPALRQSPGLPTCVDSKPSTIRRTAPRPRRERRSPGGYGRHPWATEVGNLLCAPMLLHRLWRRECSQTRRPPECGRINRDSLLAPNAAKMPYRMMVAGIRIS